MVLMDVQGCINTSPVLRQCGKVWEVTRVQFLLTPQNRHDILMCWDIYPMCESLSIVSNSTEETFYNMEHVYNESGSYKLSSEITVLQNVSANDSVDEWAMCIGYKTLLNYDWTLNVPECKCRFLWGADQVDLLQLVIRAKIFTWHCLQSRLVGASSECNLTWCQIGLSSKLTF